jgi:hypothetical protein
MVDIEKHVQVREMFQSVKYADQKKTFLFFVFGVFCVVNEVLLPFI